MKNEIKTSKIYSQALIELTNNDLSLQENIFNEIKDINQILSTIKDTKVFFNNPAISKDEKKALLNKTFSGKINETLLKFLFVLIDNQKFEYLSEIQNQYLALLNKTKGIVIAQVTSAHELDASTINAISDALKHNLSNIGQVKVESKIEPELIGGLKVKVGDLVYDGSIKGRLDGLKRRLG